MILTRSIYNKVESVSVPWFRNHSLWNHLITRTSDEQYHCHEDFLTVHPTITTKMRSILFDWLIEVNPFVSLIDRSIVCFQLGL